MRILWTYYFFEVYAASIKEGYFMKMIGILIVLLFTHFGTAAAQEKRLTCTRDNYEAQVVLNESAGLAKFIRPNFNSNSFSNANFTDSTITWEDNQGPNPGTKNQFELSRVTGKLKIDEINDYSMNHRWTTTYWSCSVSQAIF